MSAGNVAVAVLWELLEREGLEEEEGGSYERPGTVAGELSVGTVGGDAVAVSANTSQYTGLCGWVVETYCLYGLAPLSRSPGYPIVSKYPSMS